MSEQKHSIGDEIPYRRTTLDQHTGSLVFDRHLHEKAAPSADATGMTGRNPLRKGQVG